MEKLYKVLIDGKSSHGGSLEWSLPKNDKPGKWHTIEGSIQVCVKGLHLTSDPAKWWMPNCKIYLAEGKGSKETQEDKIAFQSVRLLRLASANELFSLRIFTSGIHEIKEGVGVACGSSQVTACGSSQVTACGSSQVKAYGSSQVTAYGSSQVTACDSSQVIACGSSQVKACGSSQVTAYGSSQVTAYGSSQVTAYGQVTIISWKGSADIKITERAILICRDYGNKGPEIHKA